MSAKASSAKAKEGGGEAAAAAAGGEEILPFMESDRRETLFNYDTGKMPIVVLLVWICALTGLGLYTFSYLFPDLSAWGKP